MRHRGEGGALRSTFRDEAPWLLGAQRDDTEQAGSERACASETGRGRGGPEAVTNVFQEVGKGPVLWRGESEAAGDREKALPDVQKPMGGRQRHGVVRHRAAGGRSFARRASLPPSRSRRRRFPTTAWPTV